MLMIHVLFEQSMNLEHVILELAVEQLIHITGVLDCKDIMNNIILAEYDTAIPTFREMFQQDTNRDFQDATIHFSLRNIVRAIANFKLLIAIINFFICTCRPYNVQIRILAY
jgi:hypothetical protein